MAHHPIILQKTGYDIGTHAPESADWLNVLLAQAFAGYREDVMYGMARQWESLRPTKIASGKDDGARQLFEDILNRKGEGRVGVEYLVSAFEI